MQTEPSPRRISGAKQYVFLLTVKVAALLNSRGKVYNT